MSEKEGGEQGACGFCGEPVAASEEYISATCSSCGECKLHTDCAVDFLLRKAAIEKTTRWGSARKAYAIKRPAHQLELQKFPCEFGQWRDPRQRPSCPGRIIAAEQVKPLRSAEAPAAAAPPAPAPRAPKQQAAAQAGGGAGMLPRGNKPRNRQAYARPAGQAAPAPQPSPEDLMRDRLGVLRPGAAPPAPKKKEEKPRRASSLSFGPGERPDRLRLCSNWRGCRAANCAFAHSKEELAVREAEWVEQEEIRVRRERKQRQEEEERAAAEAAVEAGLALSQLSGSALAWLREYKVQHTSMSLAEMGFPIGACEAASLATGGEVEPALEMLASGQTPPPPGAGEARPVDITREAQALVAAAAMEGLGVAWVDAQLCASHGNWHAVEAAIQQGAGDLAGQPGATPVGSVHPAAAPGGPAESEVWAAWGAAPEASAAGAGGSSAPAAASSVAAGWGYGGMDDGTSWLPSGGAGAAAAVQQPAPAAGDLGSSWGAAGASGGFYAGLGSDTLPPATPAVAPAQPAAPSTTFPPMPPLGPWPSGPGEAAAGPAASQPANGTGGFSDGYAAGLAAAMASLGLAAAPAGAAEHTAVVDWGAVLGGGEGREAEQQLGLATTGAFAGSVAAAPAQQGEDSDIQDMMALLCGS